MHSFNRPLALVKIAVSSVTFAVISSLATAQISTTPQSGDSPEVAALKAALAERDAEIAALRRGPAASPAPASASAPAVEPVPAPPSRAASGSAEDPILLSKFEVRSTQGSGYVSTNAANALKTVTPLVDVPNQVVVVTRDMIDDLGYSETSNILQAFGGKGGYAGESQRIRGAPLAPFVDDMPENQAYEDNYSLDSYVFARGPLQSLYLNASISGAVLKYTRKPLPFQRTTLQARIDSNGSDREVLDTTGPMGQVGDFKLGYRFLAMHQGPSNYFYNVKEKHYGLYYVQEVNYKDTTTVRARFDFQDQKHQNGGLGFITPDGKLYTGAGTRMVNAVPGAMEDHNSKRTSVDVLQKVGSNWDFRFLASWWHYRRYGSIVNPDGGYDWTAKTAIWTATLNNLTFDFYTMLGDMQGHYNFAGMEHHDIFGFGYSDQLIHQSVWNTSPFGRQERSMNDVAAINALRTPAPSEYTRPANPGQRNQTYLGHLYWQHTVNLFSDHLILTGGLTRANITKESVANISVVPLQATVIPTQDWIHRLSVMVKPVKDVSIYAMEATTFQPPSGGAPILENRQQAPNQAGKGREFGVKTAFLDGKISTNFAWFQLDTTNILQFAGTLPDGVSYFIPIGSTVQKGFDGDIQLTVLPGLQFLASFYNGKNRAQDGKPVSSSFDNAWTFSTRYDFQQGSSLSGLSLGGGVVRFGGAWTTTSGIRGYDFSQQRWPDRIKVAPGTLVNVFANYAWDRNWNFRVAVQNVLDEHYVLGYQGATYADPSPPRTFVFETLYKF